MRSTPTTGEVERVGRRDREVPGRVVRVGAAVDHGHGDRPPPVVQLDARAARQRAVGDAERRPGEADAAGGLLGARAARAVPRRDRRGVDGHAGLAGAGSRAGARLGRADDGGPERESAAAGRAPGRGVVPRVVGRRARHGGPRAVRVEHLDHHRAAAQAAGDGAAQAGRAVDQRARAGAQHDVARARRHRPAGGRRRPAGRDARGRRVRGRARGQGQRPRGQQRAGEHGISSGEPHIGRPAYGVS